MREGPLASVNSEGEARVSTLELFFDLVFVFTITQLTAVLADELTWAHVAQVLLMFGMIWWIYGGYAWLTNAVMPDGRIRSVLLLVGMGGFLVVALGIPGAFDNEGLAFGIGYLVIVLVHAGLFSKAAEETAARGIRGFALFNIAAAVLIIVASAVGETARYALWVGALALLAGAPLLRPVDPFRIRPAHFVERHGLLVIIVLGESIVAIGIGAAGLPLTAPLLVTALLALALASSLWWTYFMRDERRALAVLVGASPGRRPVLALTAFFYAYVPMLLGVIAIAAGVKTAIAHPSDHLLVEQAILLALGVALFLIGDILFRLTLGIPRGLWLAAAALVVLATTPLGTSVSAMAQLAALVALMALALAAEARTTPSQEDVPTLDDSAISDGCQRASTH